MATGMQPKELGINYLVLCDNTKTQKLSSKSMTMRAKLGLVVTENCYYHVKYCYNSRLYASLHLNAQFKRIIYNVCLLQLNINNIRTKF